MGPVGRALFRSGQEIAPVLLESLFRRAPELRGQPVRLRFAPRLRASRGRLLSGAARGLEVHAGSFLRRREIVLDAALLGHPGELRRILWHEIFHFVWWRAGNPLRRSWETVLAAEIRGRARGELGWSAGNRKERLAPADRARRTRRWREYACESFCDTAAWLLCAPRAHGEFTLARRFRQTRRSWFERLLLGSEIRL